MENYPNKKRCEMNKMFTREEVIEKLKTSITIKKSILLASAGDGFTAKLLEKGGIDLIGVYNTGVYRHYGIGSLAGLLPIGRNKTSEILLSLG